MPKKRAAPEKRSKKRGQKPAWDVLEMDTKLSAVEGWARQGALLKDIAQMLGISETTLYKWKNEKPAFAEAIRAGAKVSNGEVLKSAFEQAVGCFRRVQEVIKVREEYVDEASGRKLVRERPEVIEYEKYFPPDGRLTRFMLTNRLPEEYRDKPPEIGQTDKEIHVKIIAPPGEKSAEDFTG